MKIIDKQSEKFSLNETQHGTTEVKFAIINPTTGETLTPFCRCKDYFTDVFWSNKVKKHVSVYGFTWKPNQDGGILDGKTFTLAVELWNRVDGKLVKIDKKQLSSIKSLLNTFDKKLKFLPAKMEVSDDENYAILTVSNAWTKVPYLVSSLFLLIRLGFTYEEKTNPIEYFTGAASSKFISPHDEGYFKRIKNRLEDLFNGKIDKNQTYEKYESSNNIHNYSGIVNYTEYKI